MVAYAALEPLYRKAGLVNQALAMCGMMNANEADFDNAAQTDTVNRTDNNIAYSGTYFAAMDSMPADDLDSHRREAER